VIHLLHCFSGHLAGHRWETWQACNSDKKGATIAMTEWRFGHDVAI